MQGGCGGRRRVKKNRPTSLGERKKKSKFSADSVLETSWRYRAGKMPEVIGSVNPCDFWLHPTVPTYRR